MKYPQNHAEDNTPSLGGGDVVSASQLLELAITIVRPAADLARRMREEAVHDISTKSTDTDIVTAADRAVERYVVDAIHQARPKDAILGEEYGAHSAIGVVEQERSNEPANEPNEPNEPVVRWILDPIDGTVNYLYNIPEYAVSLAVEVDGTVVAGIVRNIATGKEWTAVADRGAFVNGRRLTGSSQKVLGQALVATGFGYDSRRRACQARVLAGLLPKIRDVRRCGAASVDLCMAAEGLVDAYYEKGLNPWDHAAGGLIASEAGLLVTGLSGAMPGPDLLIAAPEALYDELHAELVALDAAGGF